MRLLPAAAAFLLASAARGAQAASASAGLMDDDWELVSPAANASNESSPPPKAPAGLTAGDGAPAASPDTGDGRLVAPPVAAGRKAADASSSAPGDAAAASSPSQAEGSAASLPRAQGQTGAAAAGAVVPGDASAPAGAAPSYDSESQRAGAQLIAEARAKLGAGDFQGALDGLTRAASSDPTGAALTRRAEVYNRLGQYESARDDALSAIKADSRSAGAWTQLAFAQLRLGRVDQAAQAVDLAARLNPRSSTVRYVRYLVLGRSGDNAAALDELQAAALLNPKFLDFLEKVRSARRFVDPDDESSLGDAAARGRRGLPEWLWGVLGLLAALVAALGVALVLLRRRLGDKESARATLRGGDGRLAGKYEMGPLIGRGGMGNVYEAFDHSLGRPVAIKKMSDRLAVLEGQARELLLREARTVAALRHPAVVAIHEILEDGPDLYLVFEHVKGRTAHELLARKGHLPLPLAAEILLPVCQALEYAHSRGLVHRDLKPANIMITDDGLVKLMDFGIARSLGERVPAAKPAETAADLPGSAKTATVVGTPQYMAPEVEAGVVSKQGDVYALGVCLYELTTGRLPAPLAQLRRGGWPTASAARPGLPPALDALIEDSLRADPAQRLGSAREFAQRLQALLPAAAAPVTPVPLLIK